MAAIHRISLENVLVEGRVGIQSTIALNLGVPIKTTTLSCAQGVKALKYGTYCEFLIGDTIYQGNVVRETDSRRYIKIHSSYLHGGIQ